MDPRPAALADALRLAGTARSRETLPVIAQFASAGQPDALYALAGFFWRGDPVPQDLPRGRELIRRAAAAGHKVAAIALTNLLGNGVAGPRDWPAALARMRREAAADPERARSLALLGSMDLTEEGDPKVLPAARTLSESPAVSLYSGAFTDEECRFLVDIATPALSPSLVGDGAGQEVRREVRTSDDMTIAWMMEDPAVHALNRRLAALSATRPEQAEALLVLRYRPGQEYRPHVDWDGGENGRVATALIYLNDDYEGGETLFVKTGLKVKGNKGDVLVFRSATDDGAFDPLSEHAGLPVLAGTKFLASRWIHAHRYAP
ncbi:MAG: prolyl 4-hydroxylase [Sphingomonadales bacterium]|jgi:prolyl 4-hydroxylase|nr:prolyl 4-hydroxylase [Sphingomonadales bacterium]MEA3050950.1 prolyl 4-hydroxylase [Sphingomonadales bacterium]